MGELEALQDMLQGAEIDLAIYKRNATGGNQYVMANYLHKKEQVEQLREKIKKLEQKNSPAG